jgi:hypothetical protein
MWIASLGDVFLGKGNARDSRVAICISDEGKMTKKPGSRAAVTD